jgi:hypothetical protein
MEPNEADYRTRRSRVDGRQLKFLNGSHRATAAIEIRHQFGDEFVKETEGGGLRIDSRVLEEFHALVPDLIYERWGWRKRDEWDEARKKKRR